MMRLDNPALVLQHKRLGLLFWSASLVVNNEWECSGVTGNHPHSRLPIGLAESGFCESGGGVRGGEGGCHLCP